MFKVSIPKRFKEEFFQRISDLEQEIRLKQNRINQHQIYEAVNEIKRQLVIKYHLNKIPANYEILLSLSDYQLKKYKHLLKFLKTKPTRTLSGVTPVAVMSYPFPCSHGKCVTCPGGPQSVFGDVPQSYTGREPATMRAIRNDYDPYLQVFNRLTQYALLNHDFQKTEIIVMGGTFLSFPKRYQYEFIVNIYNALNDFSKMFFKGNRFLITKFRDFFELNENEFSDNKLSKIKQKVYALKNSNHDSLENAKRKNEKSRIRCVALCIETRPDFCYEEHINRMLEFGATRVEIGAQSVFDDVLKKMKRCHDVNAIIRATQLAKDSFLKVTYHMMLGLPGSDYKRDFLAFKTLFEDERFRPDALKIYPTMVVKGTELYDLWKQRKYVPLDLSKTIDLLIKIKQIVPKYCRIMRIQRDIPGHVADAGIKVTNLRQLVNERLNKLLGLQKEFSKHKDHKNLDLKQELIKLNASLDFLDDIKSNSLHSCNCIRCREIGRKSSLKDFDSKQSRIDFDYHYYNSSKGKEVFIELKEYNSDALIGFVRLRLPYKPFRPEIDEQTVGIRQLHVYGKSVGIGKKDFESFQHKGFGKMLIQEAERIAKEEFGAKRVLVISGVGVRNYYRRLGYRKIGVYMGKRII